MIAASVLLAGQLIAAGAGAAEPAHGEYEIKAAFLYNFARFVDWPATRASAGEAVSLCVLGEDPFGRAIDALAGKPVHERTLRIRRPASVGEAMGCDIVFVSFSEARRVQGVLEALSGTSGVLLVSDIEGFARRGGTIELYREGNRIRFLINVAAAREAGLALSSKLLRVAKVLPAENGG